jgi:hypothetical protein
MKSESRIHDRILTHQSLPPRDPYKTHPPAKRQTSHGGVAQREC